MRSLGDCVVGGRLLTQLQVRSVIVRTCLRIRVRGDHVVQHDRGMGRKFQPLRVALWQDAVFHVLSVLLESKVVDLWTQSEILGAI